MVDRDERRRDVVETVELELSQCEDERGQSPVVVHGGDGAVDLPQWVLHPTRGEVGAEFGHDRVGLVGIRHGVRRLVMRSNIRQNRLVRRVQRSTQRVRIDANVCHELGV